MSDGFTALIDSIQRGVRAAADISRQECLEAARGFSIERRNALRLRHENGESGGNVAVLLSETADTILQGVYLFALSQLHVPRSVAARMCLCAMGGYGRGALNPGSDLDVNLLYTGRINDSIKALNSFLVPFLWDIGFAVGYGVRSLSETRSLLKEDPLVFTSAMESRLVCGEPAVFARLGLMVDELKQGRMAARIVMQKLHDRFEGLSTEYADMFAPEPNIKESAGGLRDYQTALWMLRLQFDCTSTDDAVAQDLITPEEQLEVTEALDFLWRIRNELHFQAGKSDDCLTYKNQRRVAAAFGYHSQHQSSLLQFMQDYYAAASTIRRFLSNVASTCRVPAPTRTDEMREAHGKDWLVQDGQLFVGLGDDHWFAHTPPRLVEVYWRCARHKVELSRFAERLVTENLGLVNEAFLGNDVARRFFIALCNRPFEAGKYLRMMANSGLLGRYLPEFQEIRGVIRYEDFHHYPVDEHTLRAVEALGHLQTMEGAVARCLREALENLADPYVLVMAILCHDLGKAAGETHVEESTRLTRILCERMGLSDDDTERIAFLVKHHMLMNNLSQFRDTDDEHILMQFADTIKTEHRLRGLFLLSYADLSAVGPNVWTEWKGALLMQLYLRTVKRLLGPVDSIGETYWNSAKADEVRERVRPDLREGVTDHLQGMGQRYFLAFQPDQIATHLVCIEEARQSGLSVSCTDDPVNGHSDVVIVTRDCQGLFCKIAGCFSSQLLDVSGATLFTRPDGFVVDRFSVTDARARRPLTPGQLRNLTRVLQEVLTEERDVQEYVTKSRTRIFALLQPRISVPTRISFDNQSSCTQTVIDIVTGDRTGLLYDISRAMAEVGLDIWTARIVTDARRVRDSFYVNINQSRIESGEEQEAIRACIHEAIHPRTPVEAEGEVL